MNSTFISHFFSVLIFFTVVAFFWSVCVYTNTGCFCGNYLSVSKVRALPSQLGPASLSRVLMETVQSCINCAVDERKVYNLVKEGSSKVCITGQSSAWSRPVSLQVWSWLASQVSLVTVCITGWSGHGLHYR